MTIDYVCSKCGAHKCKLWRQSHVFANEIKLSCWKCLEEKGHTIKLKERDRTDQVYNSDIEQLCWVPAVPDLDGSWWGYTSVPTWWCKWWESLPDTYLDCEYCLGSKKIAEDIECIFCDGTGARS